MTHKSDLPGEDPARWSCPDRESALSWARERNRDGIQCSLDVLGEFARHEEEADLALAHDRELVEAVVGARIIAALSLKYSALGYLSDPEAAARRGRILAETCTAAGVAFEIDMEGTPMVDWTITQALALKAAGFPVTLALQAYLDRTPADLDRVMVAGIRVRLVKGAYRGDLREFAAIQQRFRDLAQRLAGAGVPWAAATHDPELIAELRSQAPVRPPPAVTGADKTPARPEASLEFGFLLGLSDRTKIELARAGYAVSEYVPFGPEGGPYHKRRLAYLKNLAGLGRSPAP